MATKNVKRVMLFRTAPSGIEVGMGWVRCGAVYSVTKAEADHLLLTGRWVKGNAPAVRMTAVMPPTPARYG